jgi:small conductance mechanosensitive channel
VSFALLKFIRFSLNKLFQITKFDEKYENTLKSILTSVLYYLILVISVVLVLRTIGVVDKTKFNSLITGAGIIGLVAGIAAQNTLRDIFSGFFILFEKQIQVGDFIIINEKLKGVVEEVGLKSITLRDWDLTRITAPNGTIKSIRNYSKEKLRVVIHVRVSYQEDPNKVIAALTELCDFMNDNYEDCLLTDSKEDINCKFKVYGISDIGEKNNLGAQYTVTGMVKSHKYFTAMCETRLNLLLIFQKNNILIVSPTHINVIQRDFTEEFQ